MINTWNESLLHEELKDYYSAQGGETEIPIDGSICDVVLDDGSIVEIQTSNLGKLKAKLEKLVETRQVNLVYPIAINTTIETFNTEGGLISRRKSPKHGKIYQLFGELTGIWHLMGHKNLTITTVFTDTLELRVADGAGSWRRKGVSISDRKLLKIHETRSFRSIADYATLVPADIPSPFTVSDLKKAGAGAYAGKMAWVLAKSGIAERTGKSGRAYAYTLTAVR